MIDQTYISHLLLNSRRKILIELILSKCCFVTLVNLIHKIFRDFFVNRIWNRRWQQCVNFKNKIDPLFSSFLNFFIPDEITLNSSCFMLNQGGSQNPKENQYNNVHFFVLCNGIYITVTNTGDYCRYEVKCNYIHSKILIYVV